MRRVFQPFDLRDAGRGVERLVFGREVYGQQREALALLRIVGNRIGVVGVLVEEPQLVGFVGFFVERPGDRRGVRCGCDIEPSAVVVEEFEHVTAPGLYRGFGQHVRAYGLDYRVGFRFRVGFRLRFGLVFGRCRCCCAERDGGFDPAHRIACRVVRFRFLPAGRECRREDQYGYVSYGFHPSGICQSPSS